MNLARYNQGGMIVLALALVIGIPVTWRISQIYSKPVTSIDPMGPPVWMEMDNFDFEIGHLTIHDGKTMFQACPSGAFYPINPHGGLWVSRIPCPTS